MIYPSVNITAVEMDNLEALNYANLKNYDVLLLVQATYPDGNPPASVEEGIVRFLQE